MKDTWMKKGLVVSVILLFIGVAVGPSINLSVVKASQEDDLVEVTTQACGIKGYKDTTVKLTREQYQNLEKYLVEFRARLNQTSTREEAVPIFKEAVVELDKYGLLPCGMSVEQVQKLIMSMCFNQKIGEFFKRVFGGNQDIKSINMFCLVSGKATNIMSFGAFYPLRLRLSVLGNSFSDFWMFKWIISEILLVLRRAFFPLYLFGEFSIGEVYKYYQGSDKYYPSTGTIFSLGMLGPRIYSGSFYGQIREIPTVQMSPVGYSIYYSGILGFTGLNIGISGGNFLIGSCILVNLEPSPPEV